MFVCRNLILFLNDLYIYRAPSPPPRKRRKVEESDDEDDIPHILQGEIARLGARFKVNLNPLFNSKSKAVHLICKLGKSQKQNHFKGSNILYSDLILM